MTIDSDASSTARLSATTGSSSASARPIPTNGYRVYATTVSMPTCSSPGMPIPTSSGYELRVSGWSRHAEGSFRHVYGKRVLFVDEGHLACGDERLRRHLRPALAVGPSYNYYYCLPTCTVSERGLELLPRPQTRAAAWAAQPVPGR